MITTPFYDPLKSYKENFEQGPFGAFADGKVVKAKGQPKINFLGQKVHLPFGIAAGPLLNGKFVKAAFDKGFDLAVYKTVRTAEYPCHPWPNVLPVTVQGDLTMEAAATGLVVKDAYEEPLAITNSFGVPSYSPEFWQADASAAIAYAKPGQVMILSFQGTLRPNQDEAAYVEDFAKAAELAAATGAKILEANLSCPNEGSKRLLCFDVARVKKIVLAAREKIGNTPLIVKTAYFADQAELRHFVEEVGPYVDGIASINTIASKIITADGQQALQGEGRLISGVCGAPIQWAGVEMITRLKALREELDLKYTLIGVGGVTDAAGYQRFMAAGADAVMCATGAMWNPGLAVEIKKNVM